MKVVHNDWCTTVGFFHAFERTRHEAFVAWRCVFCGQSAVGAMPVAMRFYIIEEEPV